MNAHPFHIGSVPLGNVPCVVGTTVTRQALAQLAAGCRPAECDVVEIRLDLMDPAHDDFWWHDAAALQNRGFPVLATLRASFEGGRAAGDSERLDTLLKAQSVCACIDIESRSALCAKLCATAASAGKPIIVSYHDFKATPDLATLHRVIDTICACETAIPKVATMVTNPADIGVLEQLAAIDFGRPKCLIGMGDLGIPTRLGLATRGSALAYGYLDRSGAPGQIYCGDMLAHFRQLKI